MRTRYCPFCGDLLQQVRGSRFVECAEHGKLTINASQVNQ